MDKYIGKMLDNRYEIIELIGSGGMANVYRAKCHRLNRMVAIKILKADMAENEEIRRRFRDESQAVAQLSHPNIVSIYDVSTSGDTEYIVMELIDGITLKQYMARRGEMDWRESLHFIIQIMRALEHAHSRARQSSPFGRVFDSVQKGRKRFVCTPAGYARRTVPAN